MAKDPAFLFYSSDFFTGVSTMSFEDRGKYITILCVMHQKGRLDEESICNLVGSISNNLRSKFAFDENNKWFNVRLEKEINKRTGYSESRRKNGLLGGRGKKKNNLNSDWDDMINFFNNSCVSCGFKFTDNERPTKDHIIPQILGGAEEIFNLQPLCRNCNSSKGAQDRTDYRLKFIKTIPNHYKSIWFAYVNLPENVNIIINENIDQDSIGGKGEKEGLGISEHSTWAQEKEKFFDDGGWIIQFTTSKNISFVQFNVLAKKFISDLDLKEDYKPVKEIKSHFVSWYNKQKINNGTQTGVGKSNDRHRGASILRESINADLASKGSTNSAD